jgi:5-methylcytosine-specific restriction endonuclease McrA
MKRKRHTIRKTTRDYIIQRDKGLCRYCGKDVSGEYYRYDTPYPNSWGHWRSHGVIDHIVPHSKGGVDHPANLVLACESCNLRKYSNIWKPLPVPP